MVVPPRPIRLPSGLRATGRMLPDPASSDRTGSQPSTAHTVAPVGADASRNEPSASQMSEPMTFVPCATRVVSVPSGSRMAIPDPTVAAATTPSPLRTATDVTEPPRSIDASTTPVARA